MVLPGELQEGQSLRELDESLKAERDCYRKVRFTTKKIAKTVAQRAYHAHKHRQEAYRCKWCKGYHLGTLVK